MSIIILKTIQYANGKRNSKKMYFDGWKSVEEHFWINYYRLLKSGRTVKIERSVEGSPDRCAVYTYRQVKK